MQGEFFALLITVFMKISFLGTGAAEGVPAMFCNCDFCRQARKVGTSMMRTRSQVIIDGDLSIDFPPEAYYHAVRFGVNLSALKHILVTHSHMDHFYAHDFILRGYKYASIDEDILNIYGNQEVAKVFAECTAREMKDVVAPHVRVNTVNPFSQFEAGDYSVSVIPAQHSLKEDALLFYIEKGGKGYLHLYDTGNVTDEAISYLKKCCARADVIAYDCTFGSSCGNLTARHMGIADVENVRERLAAAGISVDKTISVITHFSHNCHPSEENLAKIEKKYGVVAAYDGMEIQI